MKTFLNCVPCFVQQTISTCRFLTDDAALHESILRDVLEMLRRLDLSRSPPAMSMRIHRLIRQRTGRGDPYRQAKLQMTREVLRLLPELRREVEAAPDPFERAVRLAIGGNTLDCGLGHDLAADSIRRAFEHARTAPLDGDLSALRTATASARSILYLADNAGEIVADRLLLERLPRGRVALAVRGGPILNDVTRDDLAAAELEEDIEILDNGSDAPGTILEDCSETFRRRFAQADLILAKGQGNFETLDEARGNIFFLFKVKCPVISHHTGCPVGHLLVRQNQPPVA